MTVAVFVRKCNNHMRQADARDAHTRTKNDAVGP